MSNGLKDWCRLGMTPYLNGKLIEILSSDMDHYYAVPLPRVGSEWVVVDSLDNIMGCKPVGQEGDEGAPLITLRFDSEGRGFKFITRLK